MMKINTNIKCKIVLHSAVDVRNIRDVPLHLTPLALRSFLPVLFVTFAVTAIAASLDLVFKPAKWNNIFSVRGGPSRDGW